MSAYKVERGDRCRCRRPANYEVFNTVNASQGMFCRACADRLVAKLKAQERSA